MALTVFKKKYNPELQKRSLENRYEKQKEFDDFVTKLKEYSKSDKPSTSCLTFSSCPWLSADSTQSGRLPRKQ